MSHLRLFFVAVSVTDVAQGLHVLHAAAFCACTVFEHAPWWYFGSPSQFHGVLPVRPCSSS